MMIKRKIKFSVHSKKNATTKLHPWRMRVSYAGHRPEFPTGYNVRVKDFDPATNRMRGGPDKDKINAALSSIEARITDAFSRFELLDKKVPTPHELRGAFMASDRRSNGRARKVQSEEQTSFFSLFDQYIRDVGRQNGWTPETCRKLRNAKTLLHDYNSKLSLLTLTEENMTGFLVFLYGKDYMNSYIAKTLSYLNWFLRWAAQRKYYTGDLHQTFKPRIKAQEGKHGAIAYLN